VDRWHNVNRVIDNAGVAAAGVLRRPVANARAQALAHPHAGRCHGLRCIAQQARGV